MKRSHPGAGNTGRSAQFDLCLAAPSRTDCLLLLARVQGSEAPKDAFSKTHPSRRCQQAELDW